jgi:hypothetical protein
MNGFGYITVGSILRIINKLKEQQKLLCCVSGDRHHTCHQKYYKAFLFIVVGKKRLNREDAKNMKNTKGILRFFVYSSHLRGLKCLFLCFYVVKIVLFIIFFFQGTILILFPVYTFMKNSIYLFLFYDIRGIIYP